VCVCVCVSQIFSDFFLNKALQKSCNFVNDYLLISPCRRRMLPRSSLVPNALAGIDVLTIRLNRCGRGRKREVEISSEK